MWGDLRRLGFLILVACALVRPAGAAEVTASAYPVTVTDMAGRQVTITRPPQRIALQDGRVALDLALLDRKNPFGRIVVWNNLLRRFSPASWSLLVGRWPKAARIPDMGFGDDGEVNLEDIIANKPQLLIAELRARPVLEQDGVMRTLANLHIPVVFVDDSVHPVPGAAASVTLLGQVLNREPEAKAYTDFYDAHLARLTATINAQPKPHPSVFVETLAGQGDAAGCCITHGDFGWGLLVQAVGARNLGSALLPTPAGQVSMETLLAKQPDVFVMTGRGPGGPMPGFGYGGNQAQIEHRLRALELRPGFAALNAVQDDRVYGIYHPFYSSVFNIVGLEYLAKFIYPDAFRSLNPAATYAALIARFTTIPAAPIQLGLQAPAVGG
jgi:iron complex transport system substrate-binding protein